jgi:hypothetical protein
MVTVLSAFSTEHIPISSEHVKALTSSTFTVVHYDPEPFMVWRGEQKARSAALMFFGAIGGAIEGGMQLADAKEDGAKFISQTQLTDPITQVQIRFLQAWQQELGVRELAESKLASDDDEEGLQKKFKTDYVLDFKTTGWMITFLPQSAFSSDPKTFRAVYAARARLVRLRDKTVIWQETCKYDRDSSLTPVLTFADLAGADSGTNAKTAMQTLALNCADLLWRQFFGRNTGPDLPMPTSSVTFLK